MWQPQPGGGFPPHFLQVVGSPQGSASSPDVVEVTEAKRAKEVDQLRRRLARKDANFRASEEKAKKTSSWRKRRRRPRP
jgi:hypothetical protein